MTGHEPPSFDDVLDALAGGDTAALAEALRELPGLSQQELKDFADFFDGKNNVDKLYPYKLTLEAWKKGRPAKRLEAAAKAFTYVLMIARALPIYGNQLEAAVAHVSKQAKASRSTLMGAWGKYQRRKRSEK